MVVSLNPSRQPDAAKVIGSYDYSHPVFDGAAIAAQGQLDRLQGRGHTWFCGAWTRYGFHEDGLMSGLAVSRRVGRPSGRQQHPGQGGGVRAEQCGPDRHGRRAPPPAAPGA